MALPKYSETEEPVVEAAPPAAEAPEAENDTFFVSVADLGGIAETVKPGDLLHFRVVGRDANGDIELSMAPEGKMETEEPEGPGSMDEMVTGRQMMM